MANTTVELKPNFKIGDHISYYDSYWGRRTGVICEELGLMRNVDGPCTVNYVFRFVDDVTGNVQTGSQKKMKKCRKPNK